jgi:hypothetical protein
MEVTWQLHAPAALPGERATGTHLIGGWVDPIAEIIILLNYNSMFSFGEMIIRDLGGGDYFRDLFVDGMKN